MRGAKKHGRSPQRGVLPTPTSRDSRRSKSQGVDGRINSPRDHGLRTPPSRGQTRRSGDPGVGRHVVCRERYLTDETQVRRTCMALVPGFRRRCSAHQPRGRGRTEGRKETKISAGIAAESIPCEDVKSGLQRSVVSCVVITGSGRASADIMRAHGEL